MPSKNLLVLSIFCLLFAAASSARERELMSVDTRYLPYSDVENHTAAEIQPEFVRVKLPLRPMIFKGKGAVLAPSFSYENLHFNYRNWGALNDAARVDTLHEVQASLFYTQPLKKPNWSLVAFFNAGINSDMHSVTWDAFRAQGGTVFVRTKGVHKVGVGVVIVDIYGRTLPLPALTYEAEINKHRFTVRAPRQISWFYVPNDKWEAGLELSVNGGNYRLEEPGLFEGKTARYTLATFGPSLSAKISRGLSMRLDAGHVFLHKFGIYSNRTEIRDFDMERGYFFSAGLTWRVGRQ